LFCLICALDAAHPHRLSAFPALSEAGRACRAPATVVDPHFADAWAGLAEACVLMGGIFEPAPKWIARAEKAVRKALTLDRNNVEAYVARGRLIWTPAKNFQHRAALRALGQALQRRPTHDQALSWQGLVLMHIGLQSRA